MGALERVAHRREAVGIAEEVLALTGLAEKAAASATALTLPDRKRLELARRAGHAARACSSWTKSWRPQPHRSARLIDLIRQIHAQGVTILLIEHVMKAVMSLSHRVLVLNYGELICEGAAGRGRARPQGHRGLPRCGVR